MPRYRIKLAGMPSRALVAWLQQLIPVLRNVPEEIEVDVEIRRREEGEDADPDRLDGPG